MLEENDKAPDFCLDGIDENGQELKYCLSDMLGKTAVVLYFYPKDNTPGCTTQACDFRDSLNRLKQRAIVIGVSPDSIESHKRFKEKHSLTFPLLSDGAHKVMEDYEAWGEKKLYGKSTTGVIRSTYIISSEGKILRKWRNVKAKGHVDKVLTELEKL
ncbi:peroxiredoxin [Candidatus Magnetoovum chiemensis]|nr:peroxiredoxin [Candidatus Magnetoovum chiemensis]